MVVLIVAAKENMNNELMKLMSLLFNPQQQSVDKTRGGSDHDHIKKLADKIIWMVEKYKIKTVFDAGCNDCRIGIAIVPHVEYSGGDISIAMVADSWKYRPHFNIQIFDVTTDTLPTVDMLIVKDVTIHLNTQDKQRVIDNWLSSNIPWLLITHDEFETENNDFIYDGQFPFAQVNWELPPWNFPKPTYVMYEIDSAGRCMALWHRDQICQ